MVSETFADEVLENGLVRISEVSRHELRFVGHFEA